MKHVDEADFSHANHHLLNAITFDDGPNIWTHELLDYLDLKKVKVTFFVNGQNYNSILDPGMTEVVKRAFAAGHQIGSHTWSHADISQPSTDLAIEMSKYFKTNLLPYRAAAQDATAKSLISLQHDAEQGTAQVFSKLAIEYVLSKGFSVMTVGECLGDTTGWYRK
ncbi:hypothetical protein BGX31_004817 [Mortierella sp. GBA43]|nr:hypothetical protein BGX31_004817 [Mortierella sp. GBA43]